MVCLSFVFSDEIFMKIFLENQLRNDMIIPVCHYKIAMQFDTEMTWLNQSFRYKNWYSKFTLEITYMLLLFPAKRTTSQMALSLVVHVCLQRNEVGWQHGQVWIIKLTVKFLTWIINVPVFILMKIS